MRRLFYLFLIWSALSGFSACAQVSTTSDTEYLRWSATRRLCAADFQMPLKPHNNLKGSNAAFSFSMDGHTYDLLGKRSNDIIVNQMLRTASWIDTNNPAAIEQQILFHQTLFDIQEIYVRRLRQQARAGVKKMILIGKPDINDLVNQQMKASQIRQAEYAEETDYGTLPGTQAVWEAKIQQELQALEAYKASNE
ncbi:hypothetical protein [Hymenobacter volaticus]|uniref:Uncharacterized protein n=1 Tax=Hymenobacter volaticus TaxID=2932254 RepID=A0ABY4G709_9BACT|nr:hypothetical protein [Hymenobacter volaticus]UOQ66409.1 hypothetical protein MUN86_00290 [Hymenobacter volaticus]